ncbi:MAG: polyphosphate polymerase domain-containing protein [Nocardioides sp.]|uniref:polyphosphate polymerase domain-containing protein n=1 Tax=Nocardioides sp. TaxID=35761 RepID=UPI003263734E
MSIELLAPIGLDELVEQAALLERIDRKYVVPRAALRDLVAQAPPGTRVLEHEGRRTHGYRSVYLDTAELASYRVAGQRRRRRWKVRSRSYLDTGGSWLEVKTRSARDVTTKVRIPHADLESTAMDGPGQAFVDESLATAMVCGVRAGELRPVLATAYDRSTLLLPGDRPTRVTIDTALGWTWLAAPGESARDLDRPGLAIVETKGGSTPSAMDRLLWARGHRPVSISKYGVGVAALHDVPRLKWHRVLTRDLGVGPKLT